MIKYYLLTLVSAGPPFHVWGELFYFIKCKRELFLGIAPWVVV